MSTKGFFQSFDDVWMHEGVRTPMVDYCGALGHVSPTDLGIKVAREALKRSGVAATDIGSVITGNMAPGDFDQFFLPRHIGLYAGVPQEVPAIMAQRICGTGFELFRQAAEQIEAGLCDAALVVGTESMTRNPIAAFDHRTGFKLGAQVGFKDYMWEALKDPAAGINMIQTAENLAKKYGITRESVDAFASASFAKAVAAQESGFLAGEIVPVITETFELAGYRPRGIRLQGKVTEVAVDTHPRISPVEVLAKLKAVFDDGVQTGGNSSALVDAAAAAVVTSGAHAKAHGRTLHARVLAAAAVGVPPEIMGIGPAPAIRLLLERSGLKLEQIRDQRGPGRADAGGRARTGAGHQQAQREWRCHCTGPSAGGHRCATDADARARAAQERPSLRHQQRLRGRWPGHRAAAREPRGQGLNVLGPPLTNPSKIQQEKRP
jgi:acetyl-CoA C-acetyltransferase